MRVEAQTSADGSFAGCEARRRSCEVKVSSLLSLLQARGVATHWLREATDGLQFYLAQVQPRGLMCVVVRKHHGIKSDREMEMERARSQAPLASWNAEHRALARTPLCALTASPPSSEEHEDVVGAR